MKRVLLFFILFWAFAGLMAQTTLSGTVYDNLGVPVSGADVQVVNGTSGTYTDFDGNFELQTQQTLPFQIRISYTGYKSTEIQVTNAQDQIEVVLSAESSMLDAVVVSASRVEERLLESPVTVEKMDLSVIKSAPSADYFDQISKLKGVTTASGSLTFNSINTRGFGGIDNTRFVQLVDGIDNSAPLLNFPMGNLIGIGETDIKDIELVPGAASALYGPNAFNGIMLMSSLSPFDKEGLTVGLKGGMTKASNDRSHPLYGADLRFAKTFGKFGLKVTGSYLGAKDWRANDYHTDIVTKQQYTRDPGISETGELNPGDRPINFNGTNTYGDEGILASFPFAQLQALDPNTANALIASVAANPALQAALGGQQQAEAFIGANMPFMPTADIRRTGLTEEELQDNNDATSIKGSLGLYYKINEDTEINYTFKIGAGNSVYQGSERYALRDFTAFSNKLEATGKNFMIRTYMTQTDAGDSYNMTPLGSYVNEYMYGTAPFGNQPGWAAVYAGNYIGSLVQASLMAGGQNVGDLIQANPDLVNHAHAAARLAADAMMPAPGSPERQAAIETIRNTLFQHADPANQILGGAAFKDKSRMFHTEGTYDFSALLNDEFNVLVGANHRLYSLYTYGTIFNEDPDGTGDDKRININEYGGFLQVSKQLFDEHLRLTGSLRYDKNENFKGIMTPRISAVTTFGDRRQHNIRASYQTGFRNPHTQAQYIYFPASNILLGGTRDNAERYGVYEGGSYTAGSFAKFRGSALAGNPDPGLLEEVHLDYIKPEKLSTFELGYKAVIEGLYIDWNVYYNWYKDFITQMNVVPKVATSQKGQPLYGVEDFINSGGALTPAEFRPYYNQSDRVESWGTALGLRYTFGNGYRITGNYNYMDFKTKDKEKEKELGFNSPEHMVNLGIGNDNIAGSGVGFDLSYRWQSAFDWVSSFGSGEVKAFNTVDAAAFYTVRSWHTTFKLGGTNLIGPSYRTNVGGPFIGKVITLGITYDTNFGWGRK